MTATRSTSTPPATGSSAGHETVLSRAGRVPWPGARARARAGGSRWACRTSPPRSASRRRLRCQDRVRVGGGVRDLRGRHAGLGLVLWPRPGQHPWAPGRWAGAGLLTATGAYGLLQVLRSGVGALSIDNLAVRFALGTYHVSLALAAVVIGAMSVVMSLAGLELGGKIGLRAGPRGELLGGLVLIGVVPPSAPASSSAWPNLEPLPDTVRSGSAAVQFHRAHQATYPPGSPHTRRTNTQARKSNRPTARPGRGLNTDPAVHRLAGETSPAGRDGCHGPVLALGDQPSTFEQFRGR